MADLHLSFWEELEKLTQEHTLCYSISGQGSVGEEETRSTNEVGTVATVAADRMEDTPSHSSTTFYIYSPNNFSCYLCVWLVQ